MAHPEELLHFIWRFRLYDQLTLKSQSNEVIKVISPGDPNSDAGPDFLYSKIEIGQHLWIGHVEIHINSKDWDKHLHREDKSYDNVILHVVWEGDSDVKRSDGTCIPTLVLKKYVKPSLLIHYRQLMDSLQWIPCEDRISDVPDMVKKQVLQRSLVERLESKYDFVMDLLTASKSDWEKVTFILLCRSFGMKVNREAFTVLGEMISTTLLGKYVENQLKIESMFFGQAGFLNKELKDDEYYSLLRSEYQYLKKIHKLYSMDLHQWKFMRMRPQNFPSIRIGQLASFCRGIPFLFSTLLESNNNELLIAKIKSINNHSYWSNHFRFGKQTGTMNFSLSSSFISHLFINCFSLVVFCYGKYIDDINYMEKAVHWIEQLPSEKNHIVKRFLGLGFDIDHAGESQALLHLKENYCGQKKCLSCGIGLSILKD